MLKTTMIIAAMLCAACLSSRAEDAYSGDAAFVKETALRNLFEFKAGKLAVERASSDDVRVYGAQMLLDHNKAIEQLQMMAKNKHWNLPVTLDETHQAKLEQFGELTGKDFDREYSIEMTKEHKIAKERFQNAAKFAADADLRSWAGKMEPLIDEHLQHAPTLSTVSVIQETTIRKEPR